MGNDFRIIFDADHEERIPTPETLSEYVRGQLDPAREREVQRHLERDWRARQLAEQLEETWQLLDAWPDEPAPANAVERFRQSLARLVEREHFATAPRVLGDGRRPLLGSLLAPMAWAAVLALVVLSSFYAFRSSSEPGTSPRAHPSVAVESRPAVHPGNARIARTEPTPEVVAPDEALPSPIHVAARTVKAVLPPELERNYPHLAARLAALQMEAPGLFRADSPRLSSLLVAEEAGVMFDPLNAMLDLGSSHELNQAVASVAAQIDQFVARAAADAPPAANSNKREEPQE